MPRSAHPAPRDLMRDLGFVVAVILYALSMYLPAPGESSPSLGLDAPYHAWGFVLGSPGFNVPVSYVRLQVIVFWLANSTIWLGLASLAFDRFQFAAGCGFLAIMNCFGFLYFDSHNSRLFWFESGYTCWLASALILTSISSFRPIWPRRPSHLKSHLMPGACLNSPQTAANEPPAPPTR
jgi:hypothetical protein